LTKGSPLFGADDVACWRGRVREHRNQLRHPVYRKPGGGHGASSGVVWDITLRVRPWIYLLYVILDIFSRYVVGWMVAHRESATLAERLIQETCAKQTIAPGQLTLHADRGSAMTSKPVAFLLADLGVTRTHNRPHVSNDNPYSESQFKTLKYQPQFPDRFGSIEDARGFCQWFFTWYNTEHHHTALALLTPEVVHTRRASGVLHARQQVLLDAYKVHPERFVRRPPRPSVLPEAVWINPPGPAAASAERRH
jgi:putative transposase